MGARTRYFASKHLAHTADAAPGDVPQVAQVQAAETIDFLK
ncbi:MAG: hypothetical protein ABJF50_19015 [Paracoccaceae bacterium]